ncbi:hypothetical protein [Aquibacillus saliphilus]|uniref:hypothetical protein n=1 Tax=Aquibacillus saliphilus TaxID=1909422 RepID=UPI001CEFB3D2|nr:hypothetical protein [Aquibacillus saliphilus]
MAIQDIRKLAHELLDELEDEQVSEVVGKMRYMKIKRDKMNYKDDFPLVELTKEEVKAINKAKSEFQNGEYYTHEDVFGEEDYV